MEGSVAITRTLVIVAHPNLDQSRANAMRLAEIQDMDHVTVHDLYREYPDSAIDVAREQQLLQEHDTIILQFPVYWYNVTPLLKAWFDAVLVYGFAFTFDGSPSAVQGKKVCLAVTVGGGLDTYNAEGAAGGTLEEYLAPVIQTLRFCQFDYRGFHAVYGLMLDPRDEDLVLDAKEYGRYVANSRTPVG